MSDLIGTLLLPVVIGIVLFSYLEGKLHLSIPRALNLGRSIAVGILNPVIGLLKQLFRGSIAGVKVKMGAGDFKPKEHNAPRW